MNLPVREDLLFLGNQIKEQDEMNIIVDDRTEAEKQTHTVAIVGTDSSVWGEPQAGVSYAAWACRQEDLLEVEASVRERRDLNRVRTVTLKGYNPQAAHTHIYVWKRTTKAEPPLPERGSYRICPPPWPFSTQPTAAEAGEHIDMYKRRLNRGRRRTIRELIGPLWDAIWGRVH